MQLFFEDANPKVSGKPVQALLRSQGDYTGRTNAHDQKIGCALHQNPPDKWTNSILVSFVKICWASLLHDARQMPCGSMGIATASTLFWWISGYWPCWIITCSEAFTTLQSAQEAGSSLTMIIRARTPCCARRWYEASSCWRFVANENFQNRSIADRWRNTGIVHYCLHPHWKRGG